LQPVEAVAADGDRIAPLTGELDDAIVPGAPEPGDGLQIDDVAAVNPQEAAGIEALLDLADGQRAEQLMAAGEDGGGVGIGMARDDGVDGQEMGGAAWLDGKVTCGARRRAAGPAKRAIASLA